MRPSPLPLHAIRRPLSKATAPAAGGWRSYAPLSFHRPLSCAALGAFILAAGCASADVQELQEEPGYQAGYVDGCDTASEREKSFSTKSSRDAYAFENDPAYRAGWRRGYVECGDVIPEPKDGGRILGEGGEY